MLAHSHMMSAWRCLLLSVTYQPEISLTLNWHDPMNYYNINSWLAILGLAVTCAPATPIGARRCSGCKGPPDGLRYQTVLWPRSQSGRARLIPADRGGSTRAAENFVHDDGKYSCGISSGDADYQPLSPDTRLVGHQNPRSCNQAKASMSVFALWNLSTWSACMKGQIARQMICSRLICPLVHAIVLS